MTHKPKNFLVWGELPVTDLDRAISFYKDVTMGDITLDTSGPNPMAIFQPEDMKTGIALSMYPGKPAERGTGSTLHLSAQGTLEDTMQRVRDAGGEVVSEPIPLPSGRFFYALDLDGNSVGFFQSNE
ncbi:MAG: VOC family protein [Pelagimonas sp.]|uniref:VOC family protein n=1 Tax=Pelagimonas sp. TaxID=2073170 RepID=UPI003D6BC1B6